MKIPGELIVQSRVEITRIQATGTLNVTELQVHLYDMLISMMFQEHLGFDHYRRLCRIL